jgi:hypothetical protein
MLAATSMILQYHGLNISIADLEKDKNAKEKDIGSIGIYLLQHGFGVEIVMFHPRLFTINNRNMSTKELIGYFQARIGNKDNIKWDDDILRHLISFIEHGGEVIVKISDDNDIRQEIEAGRPLLVTADTNFLYGKEANYYLHANVIIGMENEYIYVNDSLWDERGGKRRYKIKDYIFGIHSATHGNFNNGHLLKVKPR